MPGKDQDKWSYLFTGFIVWQRNLAHRGYISHRTHLDKQKDKKSFNCFLSVIKIGIHQKNKLRIA